MQDDPDSVDRLIDPLIDDVARGMTAAPVDERFARRVSARLQDARAPRPRTWLLVPAAGVVALAALVVHVNVRLKPDATPGVTPDATASVSTAVERPDGTATAGQPAHAPAAPVASGFSRTAVAVRSVDLQAIAPLDVERIDVPPVTVAPIEISAIAIDRIDIAPMF